MAEIIRPKVDLEKSKKEQAKDVAQTVAPVISNEGVVFDRRNDGRGEVLVARGGIDLGRRPTIRRPEGSAYRNLPFEVND